MSLLRAASVWLIGILLVVAGAALLLAVSAAQVTSRESGERIHQRAVAVTTELDAAMPRLVEETQRAAADAEGDTVTVPHFPIRVVLPVDEAEEIEAAELRDEILRQSGAALYEDGTKAWASNDPDADQTIARISRAGAMDEGLGLIRERNHELLVIASVLLGVIVAGLMAILLIALPWDGRLLVLGVVMLAASLPVLAGAVAVRYAFRTAETESDPFVNGLADLGADMMWIPIVDSFTVAVLGAVLLLTGTLLLWWEARSLARAGRLADTG
jgi:hypothetical protein